MNSEDPDVRPDRDSPPGLPGWLIASGMIAILLVLLLVAVGVLGIGGEHGPGRHGPGAEAPALIESADGPAFG